MSGPQDAPEAPLLRLPRFDWERVVKRLPIPFQLKGFALLLATWADTDGTRVRPGAPRLIAITGASASTIARWTKQLRDLGLLEVTRRGGGRAGSGTATEYRLAAPADVLTTPGLLTADEMPARRAAAPDSDVTHVTSQSPVDNQEPESVDNSDSDVIQVTSHSDVPEPIEMSYPATPDGLRCHIRPIEMSPGRPTTSHTNHLNPPTNGLVSTATTDRANGSAVDNPDFDSAPATPADAAGPNHEPLADRCSHRFRRALRADGQPTCALCRREVRAVSA